MTETGYVRCTLCMLPDVQDSIADLQGKLDELTVNLAQKTELCDATTEQLNDEQAAVTTLVSPASHSTWCMSLVLYSFVLHFMLNQRDRVETLEAQYTEARRIADRAVQARDIAVQEAASLRVRICDVVSPVFLRIVCTLACHGLYGAQGEKYLIERKLKVIVKEVKGTRKAKETEEAGRVTAEAAARVRFISPSRTSSLCLFPHLSPPLPTVPISPVILLALTLPSEFLADRNPDPVSGCGGVGGHQN